MLKPTYIVCPVEPVNSGSQPDNAWMSSKVAMSCRRKYPPFYDYGGVISSDNSARGEDRTFGSRFALCQYLQRGQPTKQLHAEEQDQQVIQLSNHIHPVEECNIGQVLITTLRTAAPRRNSRRGGVQLTRPWSWLIDRWRAGEQHLVGCRVGGAARGRESDVAAVFHQLQPKKGLVEPAGADASIFQRCPAEGTPTWTVHR